MLCESFPLIQEGSRWRFLILFTFFLLFGTVPADGYLRNPETGGILHSPFMDGIVAFIFLIAGIAGVAYGVGAKTYKNDSDVMHGMAHRAVVSLHPVPQQVQ